MKRLIKDLGFAALCPEKSGALPVPAKEIAPS